MILSHLFIQKLRKIQFLLGMFPNVPEILISITSPAVIAGGGYIPNLHNNHAGEDRLNMRTFLQQPFLDHPDMRDYIPKHAW